MKTFTMTVLVVLLTGITACQESAGVNNPASPHITSTVIPSGKLPAFRGEKAVFHYESPEVNPDSLLTVLWNEDIPVIRAWLPLDNECMGPVGPLFTVELSEYSGNIENYGFASGPGRLECATTLKEYVISK